jgi:hypothetical protein
MKDELVGFILMAAIGAFLALWVLLDSVKVDQLIVQWKADHVAGRP